MTIKALLFDKDGTLIDFAATFAPATALVLRDLADGDDRLADRLAQRVGFDFKTKKILPGSVLVAGSLENISSCLMKETPQTDFDAFNQKIDALYIKYSLETVAPFGFLVPTLNKLAELGLPLGVATNDSEEAAHAHLNKIGVAERFVYVAGYDSGHGEKPGPGMVRAFIDKMNLQPDEVCMIGDSPHDCIAGRRAGAVPVGVTSGGSDAATLAPHADHIIGDISALPDLVSQLNS